MNWWPSSARKQSITSSFIAIVSIVETVHEWDTTNTTIRVRVVGKIDTLNKIPNIAFRIRVVDNSDTWRNIKDTAIKIWDVEKMYLSYCWHLIEK